MEISTRNIDLISFSGFAFCGIATFLALFFLFKSRFKNDGYLWLYLILLLLCAELAYKTLIHSRVILDYPFWFVPHHYYNLLLYPLFLGFIWQITKQFKARQVWFWALLIAVGVYELVETINWLSINSVDKQRMLFLFFEDQ